MPLNWSEWAGPVLYISRNQCSDCIAVPLNSMTYNCDCNVDQR